MVNAQYMTAAATYPSKKEYVRELGMVAPATISIIPMAMTTEEALIKPTT